MNTNSHALKTFRKYVPYHVRVVLAYVFLLVIALPIFAVEGAIRGAIEGYKECMEVIRKSKK